MALTVSQQKLRIGSKALDFTLKGIDEKAYSPKDFSGTPLLAIFMCNHCPYVQQKMDAIIELHKRFKDKINIIGINSNAGYPGDGFADMKTFAKERGMAFPYLFDETQAVAKAYGAVCTPDTFLFDKDGILAFHGRIDDAMELGAPVKECTMEIVLNKLLKGEKIEKPFEPSQGCSIKWQSS